MATSSESDKITTLLANFLEIVPDTAGVVISKHGQILFSQVQIDPASIANGTNVSVSKETVSNLTKFIEPIILKIKEEFTTQKFGTVNFETEQYRLLNVVLDPWIITFALSQMASLDMVYPYAYLASEKICRIFEGRNVQLSIPKLGNIIGSELTPTGEDGHTLWNFKYILIGNSGVGKTSIVNQFVEGKFKSDFRPTIGLNVMTHQYHFMPYELHMSIYDVGSQKLFQRVRRTYYAGSHAGLIVFDLTDIESFKAIDAWKTEMDKFIGHPVPFVIVGNKSDLDRKISFEQGTKLAERLGGAYIETSALLAKNIEDAFALLAYKVINLYKLKK